MLIGDRRELIAVVKAPHANHWELVCFGARRHYRKDGSCKHTEDIRARIASDWHRARTRVVPFGNREVAS